jgi:hypothetical protein
MEKQSVFAVFLVQIEKKLECFLVLTKWYQRPSIYPCKILNRFAYLYDKKSNNYALNDNNNKPDVDYLFHLSEIAFAVELALAKAQEEDSVFRIRCAKDVYTVLRDKETLEKVLHQGLKVEHMQYKDSIIEFFINMMKDKIRIEDLRFY